MITTLSKPTLQSICGLRIVIARPYKRLFSFRSINSESQKFMVHQGDRQYKFNDGGELQSKIIHDASQTSSNSLTLTLLRPFLPGDYPTSVHKGYAEFAGWNFVSIVAGTVTSVLSTQAMLVAMGLVNNNLGGVSVAATLNWIIKDGLGQLGGVIYASVASDKFDESPKRQRLIAQGLLQLAGVAEMTLLLFPGWWLPIASTSNIGKNMAYLALSATRAQMHRTLVRKDNLGDVTGKAGSQMTLASLIGTALGVFLSKYYLSEEEKDDKENSKSEDEIPLSFGKLATIFIPASIIAVYAVHRSNIAIINRSLGSMTRGKVVLLDLARKALQGNSKPQPLRPNQVSEPLSKKSSNSIIAQPDVRKYLQSKDTMREVFARNNFGTDASKENYYLYKTKDQIAIWFNTSASTYDILKGFYHACVIQEIPAPDTDAVAEAYIIVLATFPHIFEELKNAGWELDSIGIMSIGGSDDQKRVKISIE